MKGYLGLVLGLGLGILDMILLPYCVKLSKSGAGDRSWYWARSGSRYRYWYRYWYMSSSWSLYGNWPWYRSESWYS